MHKKEGYCKEMSRIKEILKKIYYNLPIKIFMRNTILLESNPSYADNTKFVFDELIRRGINKKYKLVWVTDDKEEFKDINIPNVKFISRNNGLLEKIKFTFAKYIIDCNQFILKRNKHQFRIHLTHGQPLKLATEYFKNSGEFDYMTTTSEYFKKIFEDVLKIDKKKIAITGFPRTDAFFYNENPVEIFENIKRKKTILWMPTYRNHKYSKDNSTYNMNINFKFGVPCINTIEELNKLNNLLTKYNVLLVLKLHPAEDTSKIDELELSNIKMFDNNEFKENHTNIYNVLPLMDALITDYSSVYHDYLFSGKPIGLAISDLKEYTKHVKLITNDYKSVIKGDYIESFNDLCKFIENVAKSNDLSKNSRIEAKKMFNKYLDGKSSARVVDLLEENMKRKGK